MTSVYINEGDGPDNPGMQKFNFQMENISYVCSLLIRAVVLGKIV